jgi:hypothetical protein
MAAEIERLKATSVTTEWRDLLLVCDLNARAPVFTLPYVDQVAFY